MRNRSVEADAVLQEILLDYGDAYWKAHKYLLLEMIGQVGTVFAEMGSNTKSPNEISHTSKSMPSKL